MTPQTQLAINKFFNFDGKEVRAIEQDNDFWFIVADLTKAWDLHRNTLNDIIGRNEWKFSGHYTTVAREACAGMIAVNETGMYLLMGAVHINLVKNEKAKNTIKKFNQDWPKLVQAFRKGEVQVQVQNPVDILNQQFDLADSIVKRSGMPKEIAHSMAIVLASDKAGMDLHCYASYLKAQTVQIPLQLPTVSQEDVINYDKHFSITKVASALKLPIDKVRNVLESLNIIYFENGFWKLTKHGEQYGKMFMVTPGYPYRMNQKCYIKYNPLLIDLLKKYFDVEVKE